MRKLTRNEILLLTPGMYYVRLTRYGMGMECQHKVKFEGLLEVCIHRDNSTMEITALFPAYAFPWPSAKDKDIRLSGSIEVEDHLMEIYK